MKNWMSRRAVARALEIHPTKVESILPESVRRRLMPCGCGDRMQYSATGVRRFAESLLMEMEKSHRE